MKKFINFIVYEFNFLSPDGSTLINLFRLLLKNSGISNPSSTPRFIKFAFLKFK